MTVGSSVKIHYEIVATFFQRFLQTFKSFLASGISIANYNNFLRTIIVNYNKVNIKIETTITINNKKQYHNK